jgi:sporulation-control protein spo0M
MSRQISVPADYLSVLPKQFVIIQGLLCYFDLMLTTCGIGAAKVET